MDTVDFHPTFHYNDEFTDSEKRALPQTQPCENAIYVHKFNTRSRKCAIVCTVLIVLAGIISGIVAMRKNKIVVFPGDMTALQPTEEDLQALGAKLTQDEGDAASGPEVNLASGPESPTNSNTLQIQPGKRRNGH